MTDDRHNHSSCPLRRAQKVGEAAATDGFDWNDASGPLEKIEEEFEELTQEMARSNLDADRLLDELGDLLFAVVNLARHLDVDAARALEDATDKFECRFDGVRQLAGDDLESMSLAELEELWQRIKRR